MCLSTVYKNEKTEDAVVMRNVMAIDVQGDTILLTDVMERTTSIEGHLLSANLVDGYVIIQQI